MKKYQFIYETVNLVSNKTYIGFHTTDDLNDNYLGSGKAIKDAINSYGKENFKRNILEFLKENENHLILEEKWILIKNSLVPNGYNISPKGGLGISECFSEETKKKISKSTTGRIAWNKGLTSVAWNKGLKLSKLSEEHKKKISESNKVKKSKPQSEETKRKFYNYTHPLTRLIDVKNGVAVGAMVTSSLDQVQELILKIFKNDLEYKLENKDGYYILKEKFTDSTIRIQTNDPLLTETFWNHYNHDNVLQ